MRTSEVEDLSALVAEFNEVMRPFLSRLVTQFGEAMRVKLWKKLRAGYQGWNDDSDTEVLENLREKLADHVKRYGDGKDPGQLVDIGNLVAMLWRIEVRDNKPWCEKCGGTGRSESEPEPEVRV
jgi:hypothetical protein